MSQLRCKREAEIQQSKTTFYKTGKVLSGQPELNSPENFVLFLPES
jgi:hypothetical protein